MTDTAQEPSKDNYPYPLTSPDFVRSEAVEQITKALEEYRTGEVKLTIINLPVLEDISPPPGNPERLFEQMQEIYEQVLATPNLFKLGGLGGNDHAIEVEWQDLSGQRILTSVTRYSHGVAFFANVYLNEDGTVQRLVPQLRLSGDHINAFLLEHVGEGNSDFRKVYF